MQHLSGLFTLGITLGSFALQPSAIAQIASPANAGLNSGNSALGSTTNSWSVPNFSLGSTPLVSGLTVDSDGSLTGSPELLKNLEDALRKSIRGPEGQILAPVMRVSSAYSGVEVASLSLNQTIAQAPGSASPTTSTDPAEDPSLANSSDLTNQLVASGLQPGRASQLVALVGSLSRQPSLNQLSAAINLFNRVVRESSPTVLASLRKNPVFLAISSTLRSTRTALGSGN